jgi:F-type H+-transporting ATPase subunit gamma
MAKPRAILKRRVAVANIAKITKTMQMIATARFKRTFDRAVAARPYTDRLRGLIGRLSAAAGSFSHPLLDVRPPRAAAVLAIAGNRGLCGGYNSNVGKRLVEARQAALARGLALRVEVAGKKLGTFLRYQKVPVDALHRQFEDKPTFEQVDAVASDLLRRYESGEIDELHLVYTKFHSAARQQSVTEQVLPLVLAPVGDQRPSAAPREPIFDPDPVTILSELLPRAVRMHVFQAFLDAAVSEQTARMVAMKAATDNARDMIKSLTMLYNRSRQTLITTELSEIMGGAAALE